MERKHIKLLGCTFGILTAAVLALLQRKPAQTSEEPSADLEGIDFLHIPAQIGDIVALVGYEGSAFQVEGYRVTTHIYPDEYWTDVTYEAIDVETDVWIDADGDDVVLLAPAKDAARYILNEEASPMLSHNNNKPEPTPTARELSAKEAANRKATEKKRKELIDRILDKINIYTEMAAVFGDEHGKYSAKIERRKARLARLTKEGAE